MSKNAVYFIHALSPLHPGVGQGVGSIDLPVAREKATGIPYLPGSSVKGVLRDGARVHGWPDAKIEAVFGPDTSNASDHAGAAYFGDAKLLILPVRSYAGVFAYATSPYLLRRFKREAEAAGINTPDLPAAPAEVGAALVGQNSEIVDGDKVYLEDLDFKATASESVQAWETWLAENLAGIDAPLAGRLLYLHDDAMTFLLEAALEVVTRVRIDDETGTVAKGALWFEENIPAESLLYGLMAFASNTFGGYSLTAAEMLAQLQSLASHTLQFGGKATVGRGLSKMAVFDGGVEG